MTLSIFCYIFSASIHPYINIPWSTRIWIRIHQGIALSFQDAASEAILPQHSEELTCHSIHLHVLLTNLLCLTHPSHQQFPPYRVLLQLLRIFLPQSLDTIKTEAKKRLLRRDCLEAKEYSCCQFISITTLFISTLPPRLYCKKAKIKVISFIKQFPLIKLLLESVQSQCTSKIRIIKIRS